MALRMKAASAQAKGTPLRFAGSADAGRILARRGVGCKGKDLLKCGPTVPLTGNLSPCSNSIANGKYRVLFLRRASAV